MPTTLNTVLELEAGVANSCTKGPLIDTSNVARALPVYTVPYSVAIAVDPSCVINNLEICLALPRVAVIVNSPPLYVVGNTCITVCAVDVVVVLDETRVE